MPQLEIFTTPPLISLLFLLTLLMQDNSYSFIVEYTYASQMTVSVQVHISLYRSE